MMNQTQISEIKISKKFIHFLHANHIPPNFPHFTLFTVPFVSPRPVPFADYASVVFQPRIGTYRPNSLSCATEASSRTSVSRECRPPVFPPVHPFFSCFPGPEPRFSAYGRCSVGTRKKEDEESGWRTRKRAKHLQIAATGVCQGGRGNCTRERAWHNGIKFLNRSYRNTLRNATARCIPLQRS